MKPSDDKLRAENKRVIDFANSIDQVIVRKDIINGKIVWYFYIKGMIIDIEEEKLDTVGVFFEKYIEATKISIIPPNFDINEWKFFLKLLQSKIVYEKDSNESSFFRRFDQLNGILHFFLPTSGGD
jgi:hypothetical protein